MSPHGLEVMRRRRTAPTLVDWRMRSVPIDRIAHLTMELQQRGNAVVDAVDALAMRLLLNDYTVATTHLRSVTRIAGQRMATASSALKDVRALVERELQRKGKAVARAATRSW